jgi:uncharacterized membrane protein (DUF106 family)
MYAHVAYTALAVYVLIFSMLCNLYRAILTMITYTYVCMQALTDAAAVAETEVTDATTLSIDDSEIEKLSKEALAYKQANTLEVHTHIHHYC